MTGHTHQPTVAAYRPAQEYPSPASATTPVCQTKRPDHDSHLVTPRQQKLNGIRQEKKQFSELIPGNRPTATQPTDTTPHTHRQIL